MAAALVGWLLFAICVLLYVATRRHVGVEPDALTAEQLARLTGAGPTPPAPGVRAAIRSLRNSK